MYYICAAVHVIAEGTVGTSGLQMGVCVRGAQPDRCAERKHITGSKPPQGPRDDVSTSGCSEHAASSTAC